MPEAVVSVERVDTLAKATPHVLVGLGQHESRGRFRIVRKVEPGAGPDLDRLSFSGGQQLAPLLPHAGSFGSLVERVVQRRKQSPFYRHAGSRTR